MTWSVCGGVFLMVSEHMRLSLHRRWSGTGLMGGKLCVKSEREDALVVVVIVSRHTQVGVVRVRQQY